MEIAADTVDENGRRNTANDGRSSSKVHGPAVNDHDDG